MNDRNCMRLIVVVLVLLASWAAADLAQASGPAYGRITRFYVGQTSDPFKYLVERTEFPGDSTVCYRPVTGSNLGLACVYNPEAFR